MAHIGAGPQGGTLELSFYQGLTLRLLIPGKVAEPARAEIHVSVDGLMVSDAADALRLRRAICQGIQRILVHRDSQLAAAFTLEDFEDPVDDELVERFAEDLPALERQLGARKRIPMLFTTYDRMQARLARKVFEGHCVLVPSWLQIPMKIDEDGDADAELGRFLAVQHAMRIRQPGFELTISGWRVDLGPVQLLFPRVGFADVGHLLRLVETGAPAVRWRLFFPPSASRGG